MLDSSTVIILVIIAIFGILYLLRDMRIAGGLKKKTMAKEIKTNESIMARLFKWKNVTEYNGVRFYQRIVSDTVVDDARRQALLASRKLRRSLNDASSDDYLISLDQLDYMESEAIIAYIEVEASQEIMRNYVQNNPREVLEPLGDNPTLEDQEDYETRKETRDDLYVKEVQEVVEEWRVKYDEQLRTYDIERLRRIARDLRTNQVCEDLYQKEFITHIIAASVYTDATYSTRMFTNEQFRELPTEVKDHLNTAYDNMNVSGDDLKN